MKTCSYCGRENEETADCCWECGTALAAPAKEQPPAQEMTKPKTPELIDLARLEGAFRFENGFCRPDWRLIREHIEMDVPAAEWPDAWREVAAQWVEKVRQTLGGSYEIYSTKQFLLLSDLEPDRARRLVGFGEENVVLIREHLGHLAWREEPGPRVVFLLREDDDYYDYLAHFYRGAEIPTSLGVQIGGAYPHIVVRYEPVLATEQTLAHELTHHCLTHLPIPLWLNEGVAMRLQRLTAGVYRSPSPLQPVAPAPHVG